MLNTQKAQPNSTRELCMTFAQAAHSFNAVLECYSQMPKGYQDEFNARFLPQLMVHAVRDVAIPFTDGVGVLNRHAYKRSSIASTSVANHYAEKEKHERLAIVLTAVQAMLCDGNRKSKMVDCFKNVKDSFFANKELCNAYDRNPIVKIDVQKKPFKIFNKNAIETAVARFFSDDPFVSAIKQEKMPDPSQFALMQLA